MPGTDERLERTMGLGAALAIGVGTMIGAGLFVLPGIAAGRAGPAAIVSFAIGGVIALIVAGCTAELATAMPRSGGPYYYVSRVFGPFGGFVAGTCQTAGLILASAFYLVAFARYLDTVLGEVGLSLGDPVVIMASGAALLLAGINLVGAKSAATLQNSMVATLATILVLLFGYGFLDVTGIIGPPKSAGRFAPNGAGAILDTAALVFVSYLGFVQIATVAGEIKQAARNLPLALFGSVLLVACLYMLALYVSTRVIDWQELGQLGEQGTVEVATRLIGGIGGAIVMVAGSLAALSSANASILSASRTLFAMGKDDLAPGFTARVHRRFDTPYFALGIVAVPIIALVFLDDLEPLAEAASALHLVIYALLCATLPFYRHELKTDEHERFRLPAGRVIAIAGTLACTGLLFFMAAQTIVTLVTIVGTVALAYLIRKLVDDHGQ